jgi:hypothetical protein
VTHRTRATAVIIATLLATGACSSSKDSDTGNNGSAPAESSAAAEFPACADVWVVGQALPEDYEGCVDGDALVANAAFECSDSDEQLASYEDRLWVLTPGTIADAGDNTATDDDYGKAYQECVG